MQLWLLPYKIIICLKSKANIWTKIIAHIWITPKVERFPEGLWPFGWFHSFKVLVTGFWGVPLLLSPMYPNLHWWHCCWSLDVLLLILVSHHSRPRPWEEQPSAKGGVDNIYKVCRHSCRNTPSRHVLRDILVCLPSEQFWHDLTYASWASQVFIIPVSQHQTYDAESFVSLENSRHY